MEIEKRYCQSCGMPLRFDVEEYLGTNSDNTRSNQYCYYCLKDGKYIVDIPMDQMVDIWVKYTDKYNEYANTRYTPTELRLLLNKRLPTLGRWKQQQETKSIHIEIISKIQRHIDEHLFESLDTESLYRKSNLSKYHFRRVFKYITGENVTSYIQRLRLEHIAHLLLSTNLTIVEIIKWTNCYTKFSLAKAFKKHFGVSTSAYREKYQQTKLNKLDIDLKPDIKRITNLNILCVQVGDAYKDKKEYYDIWKELTLYIAQSKIKDLNSHFASISLDNPLITPLEQCRFYLGITISSKIKSDGKYGVIQIPKGQYAIFRHKGNYDVLHKVYQAIYESWLPQSEYRPKGTHSFEMYINTPQEVSLSELTTDIYIPIEKELKNKQI